MERLPKRLKAVAAKIPPGKIVADIGTDHAKMPLYLVQSGQTSKVIATDINEGPFQRAKAIVGHQGLQDSIEVRLGNGLKALRPGEAQVLVVSGLGGYTIVDIFNASPEVLKEIETLVLSPATHEVEVRKWLRENNWEIIDEGIVEDQGKFYQVIVAQQLPGSNTERVLLEQQHLTDFTRESAGGEAAETQWPYLSLEVGPINLREKHPLLKEYLGIKLKKYEKAVSCLRNSQSAQSAKRRKDFLCTIEEIKNYLELLGKDREEES